MKKVIKIGNIIICIVFAVIAITTYYSFINNDTISELENRTLTSQPELNTQTWFDSSFSLGWEDFLSDHVLFREELISTAKKIEEFIRLPSKMRIVTFTN